MAFPFSSRKMMIDYVILRLETYPQDGGTRPTAQQDAVGLLHKIQQSLSEQHLSLPPTQDGTAESSSLRGFLSLSLGRVIPVIQEYPLTLEEPEKVTISDT